MAQPIELQSIDQNSDVDGSENILHVAGELDLACALTELRLGSGEAIRIPTALLAQHAVKVGDSYTSNPLQGMKADNKDDEGLIIPIIEEQLVLSKRTVTTGRVRLQKSIQEYQEALDEPLAARTFEIERVALKRVVNVAPEVRHEGQTTVYSLVEEELILTKQLVVKEEIRVTPRETELRHRQVITLRREHLTVDRDGSPE